MSAEQTTGQQAAPAQEPRLLTAADYQPRWCDREPGHPGDHVSRTLTTPDGHTTAHLRAGYGEFPIVELIHESGGTVQLDTRGARNLARVMDGMGHLDVAGILRAAVALIGGAR